MLSEECPWRTGPRAPLIGEHNEAVFGEMLGKSQDELKRLRERRDHLTRVRTRNDSEKQGEELCDRLKV